MINYKKTITNIHELLPELDLDTLFKIMEAIVEETTPIINFLLFIMLPHFLYLIFTSLFQILFKK